jgi:hypothetical protein
MWGPSIRRIAAFWAFLAKKGIILGLAYSNQNYSTTTIVFWSYLVKRFVQTTYTH